MRFRIIVSRSVYPRELLRNAECRRCGPSLQLLLPCLIAVAILSGCAVFNCEPATVVVAQKGEGARLERQSRGVRVNEIGRVVESYQDVVVREHWVKATSGRWYRVSEAAWAAAEIGKPLEVCR